MFNSDSNFGMKNGSQIEIEIFHVFYRSRFFEIISVINLKTFLNDQHRFGDEEGINSITVNSYIVASY